MIQQKLNKYSATIDTGHSWSVCSRNKASEASEAAIMAAKLLFSDCETLIFIPTLHSEKLLHFYEVCTHPFI